jgi:hypothetical protein
VLMGEMRRRHRLSEEQPYDVSLVILSGCLYVRVFCEPRSRAEISGRGSGRFRERSTGIPAPPDGWPVTAVRI